MIDTCMQIFHMHAYTYQTFIHSFRLVIYYCGTADAFIATLQRSNAPPRQQTNSSDMCITYAWPHARKFSLNSAPTVSSHGDWTPICTASPPRIGHIDSTPTCNVTSKQWRRLLRRHAGYGLRWVLHGRVWLDGDRMMTKAWPLLLLQAWLLHKKIINVVQIMYNQCVYGFHSK